MSGYDLFLASERNDYIHFDDLPILNNYICGHLNAYYSPNGAYYYKQHNHINKLFIVCQWKQ